MPIVYSKNPSRNRKIAKTDENGKPEWPYVYATYREVGATCPMRCAFHPDHEGESKVHGKSCYARVGRTALHARRGTPDADDGQQMRDWLRTLPPGSAVRVHVSGDVYLHGALDVEYWRALCEAFASRPDVSGWMYTHVPFVEFLQMRDEAPATVDISTQLPGNVFVIVDEREGA